MAKPDRAALTVDDLHVYYGPSHVLQGATLTVPAGQTSAIVGRNGVGKTTLINSLMGLLPVRRGRMMLHRGNTSHDLTALAAADRKPLGMALVPQGRRLFRSLTVEEHLHLVSPINPGPFDLAGIYELFPSLYERRRSGADTLSGGERSMLAIARALVLNPDMLLMDEPTEGLAPLLVRAIADLIGELSGRGLTVLLVEQKLKFAIDVASQIAVMERGRMIGVYPRQSIEDAETLSDLVIGGTPAA